MLIPDLLRAYGMPTPKTAGDNVGIESASGWAEDGRQGPHGWRFTVGGSDIEVTHLRYYDPDVYATWKIRIARWSDQAILAELDLTGDSGAGWGEGELSSPITLLANTDYIVYQEHDTSTQTYHRNPTSFTVNSHLTYVQSYFSSPGSFPDGGSSNDYLAPGLRFNIL